jgi:hypothetical protein
VQKARAFQAVTAACMLVRRAEFERAGGFDSAFRNSLEDVDLCLRLREAGSEVHYCPASVVTHLESASRGRGSENVQHNFDLFQERWGDRVQRDDVHYYMEDGLLQVHYRDTYPLGIAAASELATLKPGGEEQSLIEAQQRHISSLLREVVRLMAHIAEHDRTGGDPQRRLETVLGSPMGVSVRAAQTIEMQILQLQEQIASASNGFEPSQILGYRRHIADIRTMVDESVPEGATILVISRGDDEALDLGNRTAWHFPQDPDGTYAGNYPEGSADAVAHLEELRARGAQYLLVPSTSAWWLDHYEDFAKHLQDRYQRLAERDECALYALGPAAR